MACTAESYVDLSTVLPAHGLLTFYKCFYSMNLVFTILTLILLVSMQETAAEIIINIILLSHL